MRAALDGVVAEKGVDDEDELIAALKRALQVAEKRAQEAEKSLADGEVLRRREESRARALEGRVAELEIMLSKQTENDNDITGSAS